jgi:2-phospho-L-lactate/phosphoenolpyruvate guanylyltransferase
VHAALLIPVKSFTAAKGRLSAVLSPGERVRLARWMADRVVAAAGELPVYIACDDDQVAEWAAGRGASVLWRPGVGLNAAVNDSVLELRNRGVDAVVVAHSDLPGARDLPKLASIDTIVLVPDHRRDGTNVVALPTSASFDFSYGPASFRRHLDLARTTGLAVEVRFDRRLARDIDRPDDLTHPLLAPELPTWLPTSPVNHR